MRTTVSVVCGLLAVLPAGGAQAQGKFAGKMTCAKPDPSYTVPVEDGANHVLSLASQKCTWSQGEIGGDRVKGEADTYSSDVSDHVSHDRGYGVGTTASGDNYFVRFATTTTLKGETPVRAECTWSFTGGTGKLKSLTGKGTCAGSFNSDGTSAWDIKGDYATQ
jgi:hypothetical protein